MDGSCFTSSSSASECAGPRGVVLLSSQSLRLGPLASLRSLCSRCRRSRANVSLLWSAMAAYRRRSSSRRAGSELGVGGGAARSGPVPPERRCGRDTGSLWRTSADTSRDSSGGRRDSELHSSRAWDASAGEEPSNTVKNGSKSPRTGVATGADIVLHRNNVNEKLGNLLTW